jgi:uncharacterized protein (TIGR02118 family)
VAARLIVLYRQPEDPAAFDAHYRDVHMPIVRRYPNLRDLKVSRADGVAGRAPDYYLVSEMTFDSRADLDAAMASEPGMESGRDLRSFAAAGVMLLIVDDERGIDA